MAVIRESWRYADANPCGARLRCRMQLDPDQPFVTLPFPLLRAGRKVGPRRAIKYRPRGFMFRAGRRRCLIAIPCIAVGGRSRPIVAAAVVSSRRFFPLPKSAGLLLLRGALERGHPDRLVGSFPPRSVASPTG